MILPPLRSARWLLTYLALGMQACHPDSSDPTRSIELQTEEVTSPDVAVSPDGSALVFSLLGQLFSVPTTGGTALQLTTGPCYNDDPTVAPDGRRLAFVSNRDGSEGNVFVTDLETREITQVTHEQWAGRLLRCRRTGAGSLSDATRSSGSRPSTTVSARFLKSEVANSVPPAVPASPLHPMGSH